jgi:predicted transcriptional regulator of viral defense system
VHSCAKYITFRPSLYIVMWDTAVLTELEKVVEILKERGGRATVREVAAELYRRGYSPRMASNAFYYLAIKGVVRRAGKGVYELAGGVEAR